MDKYKILNAVYKNIARPYLFSIDGENAHNKIVHLGESLENNEWLLQKLFSCENSILKKNLLGIEFKNPIGLGAGFDYDGHLAKTMGILGFGFNTVGSVTAKAYQGNTPPRITYLPKSKSILVNKGFKSDGAVAVAKRLDSKDLSNSTIGISIGNSNIPEVNTLTKAIDDFLFTFETFCKKKYVKYFELNISCPNITIRRAFTNVKNIKLLISEVQKLKVKQPILMKMHNEIDFKESDQIVSACLKSGISGFIFSNLIGDRSNPALNKQEISQIQNLKGGLSGKPTFAGSNNLIRHSRKKFGKNIAIVGIGGVFSYKEAIQKFDAGADLVQIVTGLTFEGPQISGEINSKLSVTKAS